MQIRDKKSGLLPINILAILLVIIIAFIPSDIPRIILGLPLALFFSGYALMIALFPKDDDLDGIERVALSIAASFAVTFVIGLLLHFTPWGVRLYPILFSITLFIIATSIAASLRRRRLLPEERFGISLNLGLPKWAGVSGRDKALSIVLALAILVALGGLGHAIATPKAGERFTEFYILDPGGKAEGYPEELVVGEEARVRVGVVNWEHQEMDYYVEVQIDGMRNREIGPLRLVHGEKWEEEVSFTPHRIGDDQKVEFLLYKYGESQPYNTTHLWIDVKGAE